MAAKRFRPLRFAGKALGYGLAAALLLAFAVQVWFFGHVLYWNWFNPSTTAFMERRRDAGVTPRSQWAAYDRVSRHLKRAVVAAEDARFLDHEGFDWEAIQKAFAKNERHGKVVAGASTISQQLAKNLFLSGERSYARKAQEALITWMIERTMTKRRILELYLNVAEWGEGIFGAEAAARHHFGVSAASLSATQAAWLAAILPSPRRYRNGRSTPYVDGRAATILARMASAQVP